MDTIKSKIRRDKHGSTHWNPISFVRNWFYDRNPQTAHSPSSALPSPAVTTPVSDISPPPFPPALPGPRHVFASPSESASSHRNTQCISTFSNDSHGLYYTASATDRHALLPSRLRTLCTYADHPLGLGQEYYHPNIHEYPSSDNVVCSHQEGQSEISPLVSQEHILDDLTRFISIVIPSEAQAEGLHCARMLIDSGDSHVNLISRKLVKRLGLTPSSRKPSFLIQIRNTLTPWTEAAKFAKEQARNRVRGFDGKPLSGQDGIITLSWYGRNRIDLHDPIVWFRPIRYETTFVVVDADCAAEVVLSWNEVHRLMLRDRFSCPLRRPPTPDPNADKKYAEYERARAEKAAARQAAKEQQYGNGQGQTSGTGSANQTGK